MARPTVGGTGATEGNQVAQRHRVGAAVTAEGSDEVLSHGRGHSGTTLLEHELYKMSMALGTEESVTWPQFLRGLGEEGELRSGFPKMSPTAPVEHARFIILPPPKAACGTVK